MWFWSWLKSGEGGIRTKVGNWKDLGNKSYCYNRLCYTYFEAISGGRGVRESEREDLLIWKGRGRRGPLPAQQLSSEDSGNMEFYNFLNFSPGDVGCMMSPS